MAYQKGQNGRLWLHARAFCQVSLQPPCRRAAPYRTLFSETSSSPKIGRLKPSGVRTCVWQFIVAAGLSFGREEEEFGKFAGREPRERAAIFDATQSEAPISLEPVPPNARALQWLTAHGLQRLPKDRLDLCDRSNSQSVNPSRRRLQHDPDVHTLSSAPA